MFYAYQLLGYAKNPKSLLSEIGITRRDALKGLKFVNNNISSNYSKIRTSSVTVEDFIAEYLHEFGSRVNAKDVVELYNAVNGKSKQINRSRPQSVAAAVIYYYFTKDGTTTINMSEFTRIVNLSQVTIDKIVNDIKRNT
jgi:hypothetical protein